MACVEDFRLPSGSWAGSYMSSGKQVMTRSYKLWHDINNRCNPDSVFQKARPTYLGCINSFMNHQHLAEWCQAQVGYMNIDTSGRFWAIDKDILNYGGLAEYSPETCCFVPNELNNLLRLANFKGNDLPLGVVFKKRMKNPYVAQISYNSKNFHIGTFGTKEAAHKEWQIAKHVKICDAVFKYDGRVDSRVLDKLKLIAYNLEQDIVLGKETFEFGGVSLAA